ncbi:hypothetical protein VNO80_31664 [Phaseolus coccineus]|uniref:Uncharacterized protein n=1 Tax=Phaseolus coccineus TaxID=3886 RepID=A0AAN9L237_PHACN
MEVGPLLDQMARGYSKALGITNLLLTKTMRAYREAELRAATAMGAERRISSLTLEVVELRKSDKEIRDLLFSKSQEALRAHAKCNDFRLAMEDLKGEVNRQEGVIADLKDDLAHRDDDLAQRDVELARTREEAAELKAEAAEWRAKAAELEVEMARKQEQH